MRTPFFLAATLTTALAAFAVQAAEDMTPVMQAYLDSDVRPWATDPVIIDALVAANATTASLSAAEIDAMDKQWRAEIGGGATPTITPVVEGVVADFLRSKLGASGGVVTEIILMDAVGLNVAATEITSDMWQGDEAKHQETFAVGADAVHLGDIEFDESTQTYQANISMTITDPETGEPLGALTVAVNAEALL